MEKKSRDKMFDKLNEKHNMLEGCAFGDRHCLMSSLFTKMNIDVVAELKSLLFDAEILKVMQDKELIHCVDEFFNNNLNISETSRNSFMHRNTLIYRLDKINRLTGFNIKDFNDAVSFKIIEMFYQSWGK